jgi:hypothetical protein
MILAVDNEPVDTDIGETNTPYIEQEAHCGFGMGNYGDTYLPKSVHLIAQISALGEEVRLEDGSAWKVSPYDCSKAMEWSDQNTPVSVMQNTSWFSNYSFRIVNRVTGDSIVSNLFQGPWKGGAKSHYVVEYDINHGTVKLSSPEEATRWEIHPGDLKKFKEWQFSDSIPVIIGQNADYDASWNPYWESVLINVRKTKNFVRAHQY